VSSANSAIEFLQELRPGGPWVLTSVHADKGWIDTITAKTHDEVREFIGKWNGKRNLYYSVNPTRKEMTSKAAKTDIAAIEYLFADLDPADNETAKAAKARYLAALKQHKPINTATIDSGNGIQVLWRMATPISLGNDDAKVIEDVENRVAALMISLGSKAGTQNIDRILRVPGTTNLPNAKKRKDGRVQCQTKLLSFNGATSTLEDFPAAEETVGGYNNSGGKTEAIDWAKVDEHAGWLKGASDLPDNFNLKGRMIIAHGATFVI
jgi:hypothetical protein